jgi:hypothetical protein
MIGGLLLGDFIPSGLGLSSKRPRSFNNAGRGHPPAFPCRAEAGPCVAEPLAAVLEPFVDQLLCEPCGLPELLRVADELQRTL